MRSILAITLFTTLFSISTHAQSWQWAVRGGSIETLSTNIPNRAEEAYSIVTDSEKNIYMLSSVGSAGLNFDGVPDSTYGDPNSITDTAIVSFSCEGSFRWSKVVGGPGFERFLGIQIDEEDNIYLAGQFGGPSGTNYAQRIDEDVTFGLNPQDNRRLILMKYSSDGVLQWYKKPEPPVTVSQSSQTLGLSAFLDFEGNIHWLVAIPPNTYADGAFINATPSTTWHIFKYDNVGNFLEATKLDFDFLTTSTSQHFFMNPYNGRYFLTARSNTANGEQWVRVGNEFATHSTMVACFDSNGDALWLRENTSNTVGTLQLYNLTFDEESNIYIAGRFFGTAGNTFMGFGVTNGTIPAFLMKMDAEATAPIWATANNKSSTTWGAIALNGDEIALTNQCGGPDFTWGNQTLNASTSGTEVLLARFNRFSGECLSLNKIEGAVSQVEYGCGLTADASGDYIVGGNFASKLYFDDYELTSVGGESDFFLAKFANEPCSALSVNESQFDQEVILYPNPATNFIHLSVIGQSTYKILDMSGKEVLQGLLASGDQQINISGLLSGLYFIKVENEIGNNITKFVKH